MLGKCCNNNVWMAPHPCCSLQEQEAFAKAASLDTHKALVHIFFAQRSTKKVKGVTDAGLKARKVRKVAVIGGGLMGSGIATAGLLAGQVVIIKEVNDKFLQVCRLSPLWLMWKPTFAYVEMDIEIRAMIAENLMAVLLVLSPVPCLHYYTTSRCL